MVNIPTGLAINTATTADRTTATGFRNALAALLTADSVQGQPRAGVFNTVGDATSGPLGVQSASSSALLFNVTAGFAVTVRPAAPALGGYIVGTVAVTPITLTAANATNPRIDVIYICQPDPEAGDTTHARIDVLVGTPASTPASPIASLPQGGLALAQILVPANATAASTCTITDLRTFTAVHTGLPTYANQAALPAQGSVGSRALVLDASASGLSAHKNTIYRRGANGWAPWESDWQGVPASLSGTNNGAGIGFYFSDARWTAGRVGYRGALLWNAGGIAATGQLTLGLPVGARSEGGNLGSQFLGTIRGRISSNNYLLDGYPDATGAASMYLNALQSGSTGLMAPTGPSAPATWHQGDTLAWNVEYDAAGSV